MQDTPKTALDPSMDRTPVREVCECALTVSLTMIDGDARDARDHVAQVMQPLPPSPTLSHPLTPSHTLSHPLNGGWEAAGCKFVDENL